MIAKLGIDFKRRQIVTPLGIVLLTAGISAALAAWNLQQKTAERVTQWESAIHRLNLKSSKPVDTIAKHVHGDLDLAHAQVILNKLNMPWDKLFTVLEKATDDDVALASLKPDPGRGLVRIGGEARNLYAMLTYAKRLQDAKYFSEVSLVGHEIDPKGGDKPVHFQLQAKWRP